MKPQEILESTKALLTGHFLLTSGRHTNQYMQCAKVLQQPYYTEQLAKVIAKGFENEKVDIVISPAVGGIVIGYELARQFGAISVFAERENGLMTLRRGFSIPKGSKVVVAEDVITTGSSSLEVLEIAKQSGAHVLGIGVIVDRTGGKADLGVKLVSAYSKEIVSYEKDNCPYCKEGMPLVKPGSRGINLNK